jgi:Ca-activated chloride channel family protein
VTFIWPTALLLLLLIPLGIAAYRWLGRRQHRGLEAFGVRRSQERPATRAHRIRRAVPAAVIVAGLAVLFVGLARPQGTVALPREEGTVILAFDVSGSMAATDLTPSRIAAARTAAKAFVDRQPPGIAIGVVAFSDAGLTVQGPTTDQATVLAAIGRLTPQKGTSVGQGILASLDAIAVAENGPDYYSAPSAQPSPTPVPSGTHAPAAIVLLSDGENNESPDPMSAAQTAADRGVRIYTVGIGSAAGTTLDLNGYRVHTQLDAATLQGIAQTTGGTYFQASDAASLVSIYGHLDTQLVIRPESIELTSLFAGAGLALLAIGALASLALVGRLP